MILRYINSKSFIVVGLTATALFASSQAIADGRADFYSQLMQQRYYDQPQNARTFGMGGSTVQTSSDSSSVIGNPAGLGLMNNGDFSVTYGHNQVSGREQPNYDSIEQTENSGSALLALPIGPTSDGLPNYGNLGLGWHGYDSDADDSINTQTDGYQATFAYGKSISDKWALGYGLTYFNDSLDTDVAEFSGDNGFRHTLGVQGKVTDVLTFGSTFFIGNGDHETKLVGSGINGDSSLKEYGIDAGFGYQMGKTMLAFAAGYTHYDANGDLLTGPDNVVFGGDEEGDTFNIRFGVEHEVAENFVLRGGYRFAGVTSYDFSRPEIDDFNGSAKYNAWSAGFGTNINIGDGYFRTLKLDYGVEYRQVGEHDWQHVVTASLPFSICAPQS